RSPRAFHRAHYLSITKLNSRSQSTHTCSLINTLPCKTSGCLTRNYNPNIRTRTVYNPHPTPQNQKEHDLWRMRTGPQRKKRTSSSKSLCPSVPTWTYPPLSRTTISSATYLTAGVRGVAPVDERPL